MEKSVLKEILEVFTGERKLFHYGRDGYALELLRDFIGDGMSLREIKKSAYAHLLEKPAVKQAMAQAGDGKLRPDLLDYAVWNSQPLNFVVTLSHWGNGRREERQWDQMSRSGYHLVLQLNFANDHDQRYRKLIKTDEYAAFSSWCHPVVTDGRYETLAWARIDLDFKSDVALIEEVQSDWIKETKQDWMRHFYQDADFDSYLDHVLRPYAKVWDEAVLTAAIRLIRHDLGIREVFYNTYETGNRMKGIRKDMPPKSLYTKLPRKFGFRLTSEVPPFLRAESHLKKVSRALKGNPQWYQLPA